MITDTDTWLRITNMSTYIMEYTIKKFTDPKRPIYEIL